MVAAIHQIQNLQHDITYVHARAATPLILNFITWHNSNIYIFVPNFEHSKNIILDRTKCNMTSPDIDHILAKTKSIEKFKSIGSLETVHL